MTGRFQIERGDEVYGLEGAHGVKVFHDKYEPEGFKVSKQQPYDWEAPDLKPKATTKTKDDKTDGADQPS